jgi:hypothetical protein
MKFILQKQDIFRCLFGPNTFKAVVIVGAHTLEQKIHELIV